MDLGTDLGFGVLGFYGIKIDIIYEIYFFKAPWAAARAATTGKRVGVKKIL